MTVRPQSLPRELNYLERFYVRFAVALGKLAIAVALGLVLGVWEAVAGISLIGFFGSVGSLIFLTVLGIWIVGRHQRRTP